MTATKKARIGYASTGSVDRCQRMICEIRRVGSSLSDSELGQLCRLERAAFGTEQLRTDTRKEIAHLYLAQCPDGDNVKHARQYVKGRKPTPTRKGRR